MKKMGRFETFNTNSELFQQLRTNPPMWWKNLIEDKELYIEVRKDNYINIYYYGGCIAKIEYKKEFKATTHPKYLKISNDKKYVDCLPKLSNPKGVAELKDNVREIYLNLDSNFKDIKSKNGILNSSEKFMQGYIILKNRQHYIDSEFAYNAASDGIKRRIDLVRVDNGKISFVEVKRINDGRFTKKTSDGISEVVDQIEKYKSFIEEYSSEILSYYQNLAKLKSDIGIISYIPEINSVDCDPIILVVNNYEETYRYGKSQRNEKVKSIEELLSPYNYESIHFNDIICK